MGGRPSPFTAAAVATLCGLALALGSAESIANCPYRQAALVGEATASVECWVTGVPRPGEDSWLVQVLGTCLDGAPTRGTVQAIIPVRALASGPPMPGQPLTLTGRLFLPGPQLNPYEWDNRRDLAREGISARLDVNKLTSRRAPLVERAWRLLSALPVRVAAWSSLRLGGLIGRHLAGDARALAMAFLLGDRTPLRSSSLQTDLEATGGLHLAAVSGLHVGLVAGAVGVIATRTRISRRARNAAVLTTAILYSLMAGATSSVLRATVMVACAALSPRHRRSTGLNNLGCAAVLLLVRNPLAAGDAGFQLSFLATLGILAGGQTRGTPSRSSRRPWAERRQNLAAAARCSLYAQLATMPVCVHCFSRLALWAPLNNLILLPLGAVAITATFVAACVGLALPALFGLCAPVLSAILNTLGFVAGCLARIPGSLYVTGHPGPYACAASATLAVGFLLTGGATGGQGRLTHKPSLMLLLAVAMLVVTPRVLHRPPAGLHTSFFAVGQGDCALLRSGRTAVLVDFGPPGHTGAPGTSGFARSVLPYLRAVRCFPSLAVLTHPHADHLGGLADAIRAFPHLKVLTRDIFIAETVSSTAGAGELDYLLTRLVAVADPLAITLPASGHGGDGGKGLQMRLELFWARGLPESLDANEHSVLARAYLAGPRAADGLPATLPALLAADAGDRAEEALLAATSFRLDAAVLKVGHHGSNGSSTLRFVAAVRPILAVISVGPNRFGHPGGLALARLEREGRCLVLRTDQAGLISVRQDSDALEWRSFRTPP